MSINHPRRPQDFLLRCFAERVGDQWEAFCIDLNLAAQADSAAEVKDKLDRMIHSYMYDALVGDDREHAEDLLSRRAPLPIRMRYYYLRLHSYVYRMIGKAESMYRPAYKHPVPMQPVHC